MNLKTLKLLLFSFLLTGIFNKSLADTIPNTIDSTKVQNNFFDDEIKQYAEDSLKLSIGGKKAFLFGNAKIEYQKTTITASYIEIDWNKNTIYAKSTLDSANNQIGKPVFKEGNESFTAEEMTYNFKSKKCSVKKITTKEGEGYILGKTVKKVNDDVFFLNKGDYTTCDAEKPHFSIRSNRIKIIPGKKIITGPAYLTFFGIPTPLIFPFGYFPNNDKKSSGLIIPSYGESQNQGFFLKDGGYYFTLSDKLDLTLKSDVYTKGSWNFKSSLRYKNRYKYNGNLNLSFGKMINSELGFPDYSEKKDFNIKWKHKQDQKANPSLSFSANVEAGSSTYYRNNSYNANDYLKNTMSSSINLSKRWEGAIINNLNFNLRHSQNTSTNQVNLTIPDIGLSSKRIYPFKGIGNKAKAQWYDKITIKYNMSTKNTISTSDSLLFTSDSYSKFKNGMKHTIPVSTSIKVLKHFTLTPSFNLSERWYLSQINKSWDSNIDNIGIDTINKFTRAHDYNLSAGLNTKIYGLVQFKKSKIAGIRHVISPNLSFRYTPDFSEEKYGYYKTVQRDTEGNTETYSIMKDGVYGTPGSRKSGNISFGIGNILEMKVRNKKDSVETFKKIKLLESLSLNSSYNIFADSLNMSNIRLNARTKLFNIFDITFSSDYDPYLTNESKNNRINQFEIATNNRLARLKSFTTSIGISVNDKSFQSDKKDDDESEKEDDIENRDFYSVPWNLNANYSLNYNKGHQSSDFADTTQSLTFSGNIKITKKWKIGFRSGYDFDEKELTYSSVDIYRDLHCWEILFHWIPIGNHKSYTLTIRVKAAALRDLKYEKKRDWFTPDYD